MALERRGEHAPTISAACLPALPAILGNAALSGERFAHTVRVVSEAQVIPFPSAAARNARRRERDSTRQTVSIRVDQATLARALEAAAISIGARLEGLVDDEPGPCSCDMSLAAAGVQAALSLLADIEIDVPDLCCADEG